MPKVDFGPRSAVAGTSKSVGTDRVTEGGASATDGLKRNRVGPVPRERENQLPRNATGQGSIVRTSLDRSDGRSNSTQASFGKTTVQIPRDDRRSQAAFTDSRPRPASSSGTTKPWGWLLLSVVLLFASLVANGYMGWLAWGANYRYRELVADMRTAQ